MRLGEFMEKTGLSVKTSHWVYREVSGVREDLGHRRYTEKHIKYVMEKQKKPEGAKRIKGFQYYYITPVGDVYNTKRKMYEKQKPYINKGYRYVNLIEGVVRRRVKVGVLVLETFKTERNPGEVVNHKNGIKSEDRLENLEWVTVSQNTQHAYDTGLARTDSGFEDSQSIAVQKICCSTGVVLRVYGSIGEAARAEGMYKSTIARQVKNEGQKRSKNGFVFKRV